MRCNALLFFFFFFAIPKLEVPTFKLLLRINYSFDVVITEKCQDYTPIIRPVWREGVQSSLLCIVEKLNEDP